MKLRRSILRLSMCVMLLAIAGLFSGCAGPRLGSRIFPQLAASDDVQGEPQYVSARLPLPSEQAVRPASVSMPPGGQYDPETASALRTRRSTGFLSSQRAAPCFS